MSFEIRLTEGNHRGFLSNFITILTGYRALERAGVDLNKVCVDPSMFMLYGNPNNWFDPAPELIDNGSILPPVVNPIVMSMERDKEYGAERDCMPEYLKSSTSYGCLKISN